MAGQTSVSGKIEGKKFDSPDETRTFDKGKIQLVHVTGATIGRFTLEPGWRWSESVKPIVKTESCQQDHIGLLLSGRLKIRLDDGTEREFGPHEVQHVPPGHDAWVVGNEPAVLLDIKGAADYAKAN